MTHLRLRTQYIVGTCGLILFVSLALLFYVRLEFHKKLENELHKRGTSIARKLAEEAAKPIITENFVALQLLINDVKRHEDGIRYIYIVTKQQQIVAHTFSQTFPHDLLRLNRSDMNSEKPLVQRLQYEQEYVDDVSAAIQLGDFGYVHIGISEEVLKAEQRETILRTAPFIGLILLVGSAGAWLFASRITGPIVSLSKSIKRIAEGRLEVVSAVNSEDEIGELTSAFNTMTNDLKKRTELQHQTENELRMQASQLEEEIAERQKMQEELSDKQYQLEELNRSLEDRINSALVELRSKDRIMLAQGRQAAMGEMINNIAHQWRQPLNNLGLIVQSIKVDYDCGTLTPEMLNGNVGNAMNAVMFMSQTISDFSNFFSPDNVKKVFYIKQGLTKVIAMVEASLSKQGIQLLIEQQEEDVAVEGYFNEYNQVLLNILNNAKDALAERKVLQPLIRISIWRGEGQAIVQVSDNAGGIPDAIIGNIFEPYFSTKEHGKGSGIGLYMSRAIIQEHFGGTISAANVDGCAQFTITTPHAQDDRNVVPISDQA